MKTKPQTSAMVARTAALNHAKPLAAGGPLLRRRCVTQAVAIREWSEGPTVQVFISRIPTVRYPALRLSFSDCCLYG